MKFSNEKLASIAFSN